MSLYDGLGVDNNQNKVNSWTPSFQMLKTQLQAKKATLTKAKAERARVSTVAPVMDFGKSRQEVITHDEPPQSNSVFLGGESLEKFTDEYDPSHPNDYEKICKNRDKEQKRVDEEKDRIKELEERRKRRAQRHARTGYDPNTTNPVTSLVSRDYEAEDMEYEKAKSARAATKAAIAPPSVLMESDSKLLSQPATPAPVMGKGGFQFAKDLKGSVAHKIMSKYGFKEGKGLGKDNTGMSHALIVEKTSKRGGKIISSNEQEARNQQQFVKPDIMPPPPSFNAMPPPQQSIQDPLAEPTKVVCLRNMVGKGEVDDELQQETAEECGKYGAVVKCLIYEMRGIQVPDEEAIRIFIEFERVPSAVRAMIDLNGRFFGGRKVKASYYDEDKFKSFQLGENI